MNLSDNELFVLETLTSCSKDSSKSAIMCIKREHHNASVRLRYRTSQVDASYDEVMQFGKHVLENWQDFQAALQEQQAAEN